MKEENEMADLARQLDHLTMSVMKESADDLRRERDDLRSQLEQAQAKLALQEKVVEAAKIAVDQFEGDRWSTETHRKMTYLSAALPHPDQDSKEANR